MNNKERYSLLCNQEMSIPIFSRDWWMNAVCGETNWDVFLVERGGSIIAAMPYYYRLINGRKYIRQPELTQKNGIWISYPESCKICTRISFENEVMNEIIEQLERLEFAYFEQNFDYTFTNWLPFYWNGYSQTTRYTYVLHGLCDLERIYSGFDSSLRGNIRKAEKMLAVKEDCSIEELYNLIQKTYNRHKSKPSYKLELLKRVDRACQINKCRKIFFAEDGLGRIHAAVYVVWDKNSAYYISGGVDPQLKNSGAVPLILWEAIKFSSKVTRKFDFEGSMLKQIEKFFRKFGAEQNAYSHISKDCRRWKWAYLIGREIRGKIQICKKIDETLKK